MSDVPGPAALVTGAPAVPAAIRRVRPPVAPWPALLARDDGGRLVLLAHPDDVAVAHHIATPGGHVVALEDVVLTDDGPMLVLPHLTGTVEAFLERRRRSGVPLSDGEVVTLALSLLRGCVQLRETRLGAADACGCWWLDDDAKPLLVLGPGEPVGAGIRRVLTAAADGHHAPAVVAAVDRVVAACGPETAQGAGDAAVPAHRGRPRRGVETGRAASAASRPAAPGPIHGVERLEGDLFRAAAPAPLRDLPVRDRTAPLGRGDGSASRSAGEMYTGAPTSRRARRSEQRGSDPGTAAAARIVSLGSPSGFLAGVSDVGTRLWRMSRRRDRPRRRHPLRLALVVTGVVLALGLGMTRGGGAAPVEGSVTPHAAASASSRPSAASAPTTGPDTARAPSPVSPRPVTSTPAPTPTGSVSGVAAAAELLRARDVCADTGCLRRLQENPRSAPPSGAVDLPSTRRRITLVDDYGAVVAVRVSDKASAVPAQMVVVARLGSRWVLRQVEAVPQATPPRQ